MEKYIESFLGKFYFNTDAGKQVLKCYEKIRFAQEFSSCLKAYEEDINTDFESLFACLEELAKKEGIHKYSLRLTFLICLSKQLKKYYEAAGYEDEIWESSVAELKYKTEECKVLYNVVGVFASAAWFKDLFRLRRFGFGKLQFAIGKQRRTYSKNGFTVTPESDVLWVHIPRTGERLDKESVDWAYKQASDFFQKYFAFYPIVFVAKTWLFYSKTMEFLNPESNLRRFAADYDIIVEEDYPDYSWRWRLFDTFEEDIEKLPCDTSLRRNYIQLMKAGGKTGCAYGIFVYSKSENVGVEKK